MIAPPPQANRRTRPDGPAPRGKLPPSCATHHGFPVGRCPMCAMESAPKEERGPSGAAKRDASAAEAAKVLRELDARPRPKAKPAPRAASPSTPPPLSVPAKVTEVHPRSDGGPLVVLEVVERALPAPPRVPREARAAAVTSPAKPAKVLRLIEPAHARPAVEVQAVELDGVRVPLGDAARARGMKPPTVRQRLRAGWTVRQAFGLDPRPPHPRAPILVTHNGETMALSAWAKRVGLDHTTITYRYHRGLRGEQLFAPAATAYVHNRRGEQRPRRTIRALVAEALAAIHGPPARAGGKAA